MQISAIQSQLTIATRERQLLKTTDKASFKGVGEVKGTMADIIRSIPPTGPGFILPVYPSLIALVTAVILGDKIVDKIGNKVGDWINEKGNDTK